MPREKPPEGDQPQQDHDQGEQQYSAPPPRRRAFKTGAKPTPTHVLLGMPQFKSDGPVGDHTAWVPPKLRMWGNDRYGVCVSSEEAFTKACHSPTIDLSDEFIIGWARERGWLNGAYLEEVLDEMVSSGMSDGGYTHKDGPYSTVNYGNEATLQAALEKGPVKVALDSNALPGDAGNEQGWFATGGNPGQWRNTDHCVALAGFGTAEHLYGALKLPVPSQLKKDQRGYLLFTWSTLGFVDHKWVMSTIVEAMVRVPNTITNAPSPDPDPDPEPDPNPNPSPNPLICFVEFAVNLFRGMSLWQAGVALFQCLRGKGKLQGGEWDRLMSLMSSGGKGDAAGATLEQHQRRHGRTVAPAHQEESEGDAPKRTARSDRGSQGTRAP